MRPVRLMFSILPMHPTLSCSPVCPVSACTLTLHVPHPSNYPDLALPPTCKVLQVAVVSGTVFVQRMHLLVLQQRLIIVPRRGGAIAEGRLAQSRGRRGMKVECLHQRRV